MDLYSYFSSVPEVDVSHSRFKIRTVFRNKTAPTTSRDIIEIAAVNNPVGNKSFEENRGSTAIQELASQDVRLNMNDCSELKNNPLIMFTGYR